MRRPLVVLAVLMVAMTTFARPVLAQNQVSLGFYPSIFDSFHEDEVGIGFRGPWGRRVTPNPTIAGQVRDLTWSWTGEIRIGHEWGGGSVFEVLGGLRASNDTLLKWPCFADLKVGIIHFPGQNRPIIHPSVGFEFPNAGRNFNWWASVGAPIVFFNGVNEIGLEGGIGLSFGMKR